MAKYTMKYGDLIDGGIIAAADLPAAWVNFPALKYPQPVGDVSFIDLFYKRYQNREISGDTVPTFLMFLESTTAEVLEMLPDGLYSNLLKEAISVETAENRERKTYAAPNGDLETAYIIAGETDNVTHRREYESELEKAEHLMREGKPIAVWICDRYEKCFMGVW